MREVSRRSLLGRGQYVETIWSRPRRGEASMWTTARPRTEDDQARHQVFLSGSDKGTHRESFGLGARLRQGLFLRG